MSNILGQRLKARRKELRISQQELLCSLWVIHHVLQSLKLKRV